MGLQNELPSLQPTDPIRAFNTLPRVEPGSQRCVHSLFERHAAERPQAIALRFEGESTSYRDLNDRADGLATQLRARGVNAGSLVAICMPRSADMVVAMLATLKAGAAYVPMDPAYPPDRLQFMLGDCHAALVLTARGSHSVIHAAGTPTLAVDGPSPAVAVETALPERAARATDLVYAIYTSGSTGQPKAAMNTHAGLVNQLNWFIAAFSIRPGDRVLQQTQFSFDVAAMEFFSALCAGATLVIAKPSRHLDPGYLSDLIEAEGVTSLHFVPSVLRVFLGDVETHALATVRQVICAGEALPASLATEFMRRFPKVGLHNLYGPAETAVYVSHWDCSALQPGGNVLIGRPVANTRLYVLDEHGAAAAIGTAGELCIAGVQVGTGYVGRSELTAQRFVADPFADAFADTDHAAMYKTGDLARWLADGNIEYLGRLDFQVKVAGQRVELGEIEAALERCAGVKQATVVPQPDTHGDQRLRAFVTLTTAGTAPTPGSLRQQLASSLPAHMLPAQITVLGAMPLSPNGKVDRARLLATAPSSTAQTAAPSPQPGGDVASTLRASFARHAERAALADSAGALSYAGLDRASEHLCRVLRDRGVRAGDTMALCVPRSRDAVLLMIAAIRCGAVYAPIDLASPAQRIKRMLAVLRPQFLVRSGTASLFAASEGTTVLDLRDLLASTPVCASSDWPSTAADATLCVMFTSGSTGEPKGVCVPHSGVVRLVCDADYAWFDSVARWGFMSSLAFDASHLEIWGPLLNGGCCVVWADGLPSIDSAASFFVTQKITDAWLTSSLFNALIEHAPASLRGLRQLLIGGERLSPRHVAQALEQLPGLRMINGYGPTENTTFSLCHTITRADTLRADGIPIGRPIHGTLARVQGLADGAAEDDAEGELWVAGQGVANGYLGDLAATAAQFEWRDGTRWYRTGDRVRLRADGAFDYLGRIDRQVKLQGHRVEVDEVELALLACPGVATGAVLVVGADAQSRHLAAFYCAGAGAAAPVESAVRACLAQRLHPSAMPRRYHALVQLPLNANGKADHDALAALLAPGALPAVADAEPPTWRTPEERQLAAIWAELLKVQALTRDSNFQQLGGGSMLAMALSATLRREMRRDLPPIEVLLYPVLRDQAARLALAPVAVPNDLASASPDELLTQQQRALLAASEFDPSGCAMLVHIALAFPAAPDWNSVRTAIAALWQRHPMLQVAASLTAARMLAAPPPHWWAVHADTGPLPADMAWPDDLRRTVNRPLDTAEDGPMRVDVWPDRGAGGGLLVWTFHHHAVDEASIDRLLDELTALLAGKPLAPVYGSPFTFGAIERAWTRPELITARANELASQFARVEPPLPRAPGFGDERAVPVPPDLARQLLAACERRRQTPFVAVLTAFGGALQDVFGETFRQVLTPVSRRAEPELVEPVGYLLDVRHIEAGLRPQEGLGEALERVARQVQQLHSPTFVPLEQLTQRVACFSPEAAACLTAFAFTWRLAPTRELQLGPARAQLVRVPQVGARFGLTLHAALIDGALRLSIEALQPAFDSGSVGRVAAALERRLRAVSDLITTPAAALQPAGAAAQVAFGTPLSAAEYGLVGSLWCEALGTPDVAPDASAHFIALGGSSIAAMRMSTRIRKQLGARLDVGAFLADPTFGRLGQLLCGSNAEPLRGPSDLILLGPANYDKVILFVPGKAQATVGLFKVASELRPLLPAGCAVGICDLQSMIRGVPDDRLLDALLARLETLVTGIGATRIAGIAGFSLGGLLALRLAKTLGGGRALPVWLLDTYAPAMQSTGWIRRVERAIARRLFAHPVGSGDESPSLRAGPLLPVAADENVEAWDGIMQALIQMKVEAATLHATLIQAEDSVRDSAILWNRATNGFSRSAFAQLRVCPLPTEHLDLVRDASGLVAHVIAASLGG